jgi:hypothetical protein
MKVAPTAFVSASNSRGCSTRPKTRSDREATETGHPCVATTTTAATTDVAVETTIIVTTDDVITSRQRTTVMSVTYLAHPR